MNSIYFILAAFISLYAQINWAYEIISNYVDENSTNTASASSFSMDQAEISVYLSAAAFCNKYTYTTRTFVGPTSGFVATYVIYDEKTDTTGYIGFLPKDKSIYIVFRGSSSIANWIVDLDALKIPYSSFPECNCQVHKGFYEAEQRVISSIISEVERLIKLYGYTSVKVTGHSLGAALAQLTSMDLYKAGLAPSVYNYGQPRTGDQAYSKFATPLVPLWRVTHDRDTVPHLPLEEKMSFYHVCREEFENENGNFKTCDTSCEDPTCADQFSADELDSDDHMYYLGLYMSCESVSSNVTSS